MCFFLIGDHATWEQKDKNVWQIIFIYKITLAAKIFGYFTVAIRSFLCFLDLLLYSYFFTLLYFI